MDGLVENVERVHAPAENQDAVLTAAYNVGPDYVQTFLKTFRSVNPSARIIPMVWDDHLLREIAAEYGAELDQDHWFCRHVPQIKLRYKQAVGGALRQKRVRITELLGRSNPLALRASHLLPEPVMRSLVSISLGRWFQMRDILAREPLGQVLLSDCRDVFFQADPSNHQPNLSSPKSPITTAPKNSTTRGSGTASVPSFTRP